MKLSVSVVPIWCWSPGELLIFSLPGNSKEVGKECRLSSKGSVLASESENKRAESMGFVSVLLWGLPREVLSRLKVEEIPHRCVQPLGF